MDTHYRQPEEANKIIYGEWVVYTDPYNGPLLATIQDIEFKKHHIPELPAYTPDTSYTITDGKISYAESFKVKVQFRMPRTGVYHITMTHSGRIRPMTEEENRDLEIYYSGDLSKYPLILNNPLLREAVTKNLREGHTPRRSIFL